MSAVEGGRKLETRMEAGSFAEGGDARHESPPDEETIEVRPPPPRVRLPWIGALENPRLGPMVVLNDSGYLVPMLTAGDLLRVCKYYWHRSQE